MTEFEIQSARFFRTAVHHVENITVEVNQPANEPANVSWDAPLSGRDADATRRVIAVLTDAANLAETWTTEKYDR